MEQPVVRAVDVGFGNVKFITEHQQGEDAACELFPSLAPQAISGSDIGAGLLNGRRTVVVDVNGALYEVGRDSEIATDSSHGRVLDPSYPKTDSYMALLLGALSYMAQPKIDLLVLGLPVNTYDHYKQSVHDRVVGVHRVPNPLARVDRKAPVEMDVDIRHVWVVPQPLGGFFDYSIRNGSFGQMKNQINLVVDVGFFTLDWLVANGTQVIPKRSGAANGGMSAVLNVMADALGQEHKTQLNTSLKRIDEAIRTGEPFRLFGKEVDISRHISLGRAKAVEFVSTLASRVGDGADIDNIIISGGGAQFFKEVIQEKFPRHEIVVAHDPVFSNVRGFQYAGEMRVFQILARANHG